MEENGGPPIEKNTNELLRVPSLGKLSALALLQHGIRSISELREAGLEKIKSIEHIGARRASDIYMDIQKGKVEEEPDPTEEFECPDCDNFVRIKDEKCQECGKTLELEEGPIVPDRGVINDPKNILAEIEQEIWEDGDDPELWFIRGAILENFGAKKKALKAYDKVIELDPLYEHIWNAKAALSLKLGKNQEAARAYKVAFDSHGAPAEMMENISERPSVEEKVEFEFEEDKEVKKVEEKISEARAAVKNLSGEDIDLVKMRSLLDEATEARLDDETDLALEKAEEVIKKCEDAQSFLEALKEAEERLTELKKKDEERYERYQQTLTEIEESREEEGFEELVEKTQRLIYEIDEATDIEKEKETELSEMIEAGKKILQDKKKSHLRIGPLKNDLKEAIKKKKMGKFEEGIENVEAMQKKAEVITEIEKLVDDFKEKLKDIEREDLSERVKADMKDIIKSSKDGRYGEIRDQIQALFYALEWESEKGKIKEDQEKTLREKIAGLKELKDELSEEAAKTTGVIKAISEGEEDLQEKDYKSGIQKCEQFLEEKDILKEIPDLLKGVEELLEEGKEKGIELQELEKEYQEMKEDIPESDKKKSVDRLEDLLEAGKASLRFIPVVSEIEKKIEEGDEELEEYSSQLEELRERFDSGERETAIKKAEELKDDIDMIMEMKDAEGTERGPSMVYECPNCGAEVSEDDRSCENCGIIFEEEEIDDQMKEALDESKEILAYLRGTELGLTVLKNSIKKATKAKKEGDDEKARRLAEQASEASNELKEIHGLCEKTEKKLDELVEGGIITDKKDYESEFERFREATDIGVYKPVKNNLEDLLHELDDMPKEDERNIAKEIKAKIKDLKELHAHVEKSGIDIQINRQYLTDAVKNIKSKAYKEAFKTLSEGEKDLLDELEPELKAKIESLSDRIERSDVKVGEDRVQMFVDEIGRRQEWGNHSSALELLPKVSELVRALEESGSETERGILMSSKIIDDMENSGLDMEKEKDLLEKAKEMDDGKQEIKKAKNNLTSKLDERIKEEIETVEESVENIPREKASFILDRLKRAEAGRREDNVHKMTWFWKEYVELLEEG